LARIAELEKKTEARKKGALEFRVGEKGGVSVYGLGRFPVTLYTSSGSASSTWLKTSANSSKRTSTASS